MGILILRFFIPNRKIMKGAWRIVKESFSSFIKEDAFTYSASISFYTMLSLPAVLIIVVSIAAVLYEENRIQQELIHQFSVLIGYNTSDQIESILSQNTINEDSSLLARSIGIGTLIFSSTSVFISLQLAINKIWQIEAKPERAWLQYIINRLLSFAMVLGIGFVLLVSLVIEALLVLFKNYLQRWNDQLSAILLEFASEVISFGIVVLIFSLMFKVLPDAKLRWRDVWVGGLITAVLFVIGKWLIGLYLGASTLTSLYGASGSLVVLLVWTYYASLIFLFGAKITHVYTKHRERKLETYESAVEVRTIKIEKNTNS